MNKKTISIILVFTLLIVNECCAKMPTINTSEIFSWIGTALQVIATVAGAVFAVLGSIGAAWKYSDDHSQMWKSIGMSWLIGGTLIVIPNAIAWLI